MEFSEIRRKVAVFIDTGPGLVRGANGEACALQVAEAAGIDAAPSNIIRAVDDCGYRLQGRMDHGTGEQFVCWALPETPSLVRHSGKVTASHNDSGSSVRD